MTSRIDANDTPPARQLVLPAVPIITTVQGIRRSNPSTSPVNPSPLRESAVTAAIGVMTVQDTPVATPVADDKSSATDASNTNVILHSMTPPDSGRAEGPVIVDGSRSRPGLSARAHSTGSIFPLAEVARSPTWEAPAGGVVKKRDPEDPFVSSPPDAPQAKLSAASVTPAPNNKSQLVQESSLSANMSPRVDRLGETINPNNAQGLLEPEACVFVANLSNQRVDDQLEVSVQQVFSTFGTCYVKIRRDRNRMPFAFVQFEKVEDARSAIHHARGLVIDGRPIRTEGARVHRAVCLARLTGGPVHDGEARGVLEAFGAIEETAPVSVADQEATGMPEGIWVKFRYWNDCKDAMVAFRQNEHYRLYQHNVDDLRQRGPTTTSPGTRYGRGSAGRSARQVMFEATSVFVGNLPPDTTQAELAGIFSQYGEVADVSVIRKPKAGNEMNTFAFVAFRTPAAVQNAVASGISIRDWHLRVEHKECSQRHTVREHHMQPSPTRHHDQILAHLYEQGLQLGLPQDQAARILGVGHSPVPYGNVSPMNALNNPPSYNYATPFADARGSNAYDYGSSPTPTGHVFAGTPMTSPDHNYSYGANTYHGPLAKMPPVIYNNMQAIQAQQERGGQGN